MTFGARYTLFFFGRETQVWEALLLLGKTSQETNLIDFKSAFTYFSNFFFFLPDYNLNFESVKCSNIRIQQFELQ